MLKNIKNHIKQYKETTKPTFEAVKEVEQNFNRLALAEAKKRQPVLLNI